MLCIFIQLRKKLVLSIASSICKFGIIIILPNNSWVLWCFRSARLVVYSVHAQCMRGYAAMAIRCPGRAGNHPRRALVCGACFAQRFRVCTPPPLPRGCRKNGAALRRQPMRYDTQPFETSHQTSSRSTFNASSTRVQPTAFFTSSQRYFIHFLVTCI